MAIIVILCGAPHLYKKDMNNSGLYIYLYIYHIFQRVIVIICKNKKAPEIKGFGIVSILS